jgi:hypothetical protein
MVAELASLDRLVWIGVSRPGLVGVSRGCQFALSPWAIPLVSGQVMAQGPKGLMQRSLPALRTTRRAADDLEVAAASCARRSAVAWPPVDDDSAWLPEVTEAAVLWETRERQSSCLLHGLYPNI